MYNIYTKYNYSSCNVDEKVKEIALKENISFLFF